MPIDLSRARYLSDRYSPWMKERFNLHDWTIARYFEPLPNNTYGLSSAEVDYRRASISIDPASCEDDKECLRGIRHEMLHIMLADFQTLEKINHAALPSAVYEPVRQAELSFIERAVFAVEQALDNLGFWGQMYEEVGPLDPPPKKKKKKKGTK